MTKKITQVPMTNYEMAVAVEALKVFRQMIVASGAVEFFSKKEQRDLLADVRVDVEQLTEKIDRIWRGK